VSTNAHYTFPVTVNRTLVANFVPAYTITAASYPTYAGSVTGAGVYNEGSTVTLVATPNHGFVFSGWSDGATTATYSFPATGDYPLTAFFVSSPLSVAFDFDSAQAMRPFPLDTMVDGLSAHLTGTGQGYSLQVVGTVGIAPAGFSGQCIFPSSVFASDLIIDFSETLADFSIMYAPQELACDASAIMRVTVYQNGVYVATNTTTAPVPGTYPTGTLTIAAPAGFNRAVVHYDSHGGTCQDWGPIFLADNMIVTRRCVAPAVTADPTPLATCTNTTASFTVVATGTVLRYEWQRDGVAIDPATNPSAALPTLVLNPVQLADAGSYTCVLTNPCGTATSAAASLTVTNCACSVADIAGGGATGQSPDGIVDGSDYIAFINSFSTGDVALDPLADVVPDGIIDGNDFIAFINAFAAGC
jgi:hypothetical protein